MNLDVIEKAEEELRLAMLSSDVSALKRLLAEDLSFTTFLGETISKKEDLEAHESGFLHFHTIDLSEVTTRWIVEGKAAVVTCTALIEASFDEDRTSQKFRFTRGWTLESGAPQVLFGQATLVYAEIPMS